MLSSTTATLNDWPMLMQLLATSMPTPMCSCRVLHCCLHTSCALTGGSGAVLKAGAVRTRAAWPPPVLNG